MKIINTRLDNCLIIEPRVYGDDRGFFLETFHLKRYSEQLNFNFEFVQDNHSRSSYGVLRGLHFQNNNPQGKLVRVTRGEVFDVAIDLRKDSHHMVCGRVFISQKIIRDSCGFHQALPMALLLPQKLQTLSINVLISMIPMMRFV